MSEPTSVIPKTVIPGLVPGTHRATYSNTAIAAQWVPAMNAGMTLVVVFVGCDFIDGHTS